MSGAEHGTPGGRGEEGGGGGGAGGLENGADLGGKGKGGDMMLESEGSAGRWLQVLLQVFGNTADLCPIC